MEIFNTIKFISVFLTIYYLVVVSTFIRGWHKIKQGVHPAEKIDGKTLVTVIIAARNEEGSIAKTLDDLIAQRYPKELTEIIFVDDHSTDRTSEIIRSYAKYGVKLIVLNEDSALNSYKKMAIQRAIGQSSGQLIITTDADCRMGPNWLQTIIAFYEANSFKMISSPVSFFEERNFFEKAQSLEFLYLIGLGASTIGNERPSTCNGANLAYEKQAFYEVGGFKGIDELASGDDELLLHKMAAKFKKSIGFLKNEEAMVYTHAKRTLAEFLQQRKRWASKSTKYKNKAIIVLGVGVWLFNLSILVNLLLAMVNIDYLKIGLSQLASKVLFEFFFLYGVTKFANRRALLALQPVLSVAHIVYIIYIGIAGNTGKYNWKGRMVR